MEDRVGSLVFALARNFFTFTVRESSQNLRGISDCWSVNLMRKERYGLQSTQKIVYIILGLGENEARATAVIASPWKS